ncbi:YtxH domain-containing protein [Bacillus sp. Marseille-P3661]|uniref:YtxH domain-containing protein n=1 Tax=Bacillus sp. Marseille-P3661 TaxID=1936234 RepID=UPI000C8487F9|nr:YtxH domain-containing protein [Bacillus sp. Marseille-P3661]
MSENQGQINNKDFLIGTLIGGIVGASVALFLAPKSGKQLRSELNEQALIAKEVSGQIAETAKKKTTNIIEKVKSTKADEEIVQLVTNDEGIQDVLAVPLDEIATTEEIQQSKENSLIEISDKLKL